MGRLSSSAAPSFHTGAGALPRSPPVKSVASGRTLGATPAGAPRSPAASNEHLMPTANRRRPDPLDPDVDLDGYSSDELEETVFGPDPSRPRERAPRRRTASRPAAPRATKFCHACATTLDARAELCPGCGVRQPTGYAPTTDKSRVAAALIAFFLGWFGGQKFYLGRPGAGILCVLFFWTTIPSLIGLYDAIVLLTMSDERFAQRYG